VRHLSASLGRYNTMNQGCASCPGWRDHRSHCESARCGVAAVGSEPTNCLASFCVVELTRIRIISIPVNRVKNHVDHHDSSQFASTAELLLVALGAHPRMRPRRTRSTYHLLLIHDRGWPLDRRPHVEVQLCYSKFESDRHDINFTLNGDEEFSQVHHCNAFRNLSSAATASRNVQNSNISGVMQPSE
jgi:hypothetical protein